MDHCSRDMYGSKSLGVSSLRLRNLKTTNARNATLRHAAFIFTRATPGAMVLVNIGHTLRTHIGRLTNTTSNLNLFSLLVNNTYVTSQRGRLQVLITTYNLNTPIGDATRVVTFLLPYATYGSIARVAAGHTAFRRSSQGRSRRSLGALRFRTLGETYFNLLRRRTAA